MKPAPKTANFINKRQVLTNTQNQRTLVNHRNSDTSALKKQLDSFSRQQQQAESG